MTSRSTQETIPDTSIVILVVDDQFELMVPLLEHQFRTDNIPWQLIGVPSCKDAVEAHETRRFDCILMDQRMPGEEGLECIPKLRLIDRQSAIIFMSGFLSHQVISAAISAGADDCITKSREDMERLGEVIAKNVMRRRRHRDIDARAQEQQSRIEWIEKELSDIVNILKSRTDI